MAAAFPIDFQDHQDDEGGEDLSARQREAFEALSSEIANVDPLELIAINIDIPAAVITVSGRLSRIHGLRDSVAREMPFFDIMSFDKLEQTALAVAHAHVEYLTASLPAEPVPPLVETLMNAREYLLADVTVLAKRNIVDAERLKQLQGTTGHKNITFDVLLLCNLFREHWNKINGRTAVKLTELARAEGVANRLTTALGAREAGNEALPEAAAIRQKAFTLFVNRYDEVRRAVTFLRWHAGDIDTIAPSLYAGRTRKPSDDAGDTPAGPDAPTNATPAISPATPGAPAAPGSPAASASSATNGSPGPTAASLIGLPGDTPFGH